MTVNPTTTASAATSPSIEPYLGDTVHLLPQTNQLRALHTVIRDRAARREDFLHCSSRILRLLLESALDLLPYEEHTARTPVGAGYRGLRMSPAVHGVAIARAGESMESELRAVLPAVRMGKILLQRDKVTKLPHFYYAALPPGIADGHVLLLDPMLATGGTALAAIQVLLDHGVPEDRIVFVGLIAVPEGITAVCGRHPRVRIVTSAIDQRLNENAYMVPGIGDFGDRWFGTDR